MHESESVCNVLKIAVRPLRYQQFFPSSPLTAHEVPETRISSPDHRQTLG